MVSAIIPQFTLVPPFQVYPTGMLDCGEVITRYSSEISMLFPDACVRIRMKFVPVKSV